MELLECGHAATAGKSRLCRHLLVEEPPGHYRVLTGVRVRYDLACEECADSPELLTSCEGCVDRACEFGWSDVLGWKGTPQVVHEDRPMRGEVRARSWDARPLNDRCLAPLPDGWLALTETGLVSLADGLVHEVRLAAGEHPRAEPALHTSPDGRYAAVVTDFGSKGLVLDLRSGAVVVELDRGTYHVEQTPFPVAFLSGRVVAATEWNRLAVFDLATGAVVRQEDAGGYCFHGRLTGSPDGRWLLDDSWLWHPLGVPQIYDPDLRSIAKLADRAYAWGQPVAWVTPDVVAVQRIGADDEAMLDGVELYSVPDGRPLEPFAGPAGPMWGFQGLLYVSGSSGFEVWDPSRGARIGLVAGFRPVAHRDGTFAELRDGQLYSFSVD